MIELKDLSRLRRVWIERANIPANRLGFTRSDIINIPDEISESVEDWLEILYACQNIRAFGNRSCGQGLIIAGGPNKPKAAYGQAILQEILRYATTAAFAPKKDNNGSILYPGYCITVPDLIALRFKAMDYASDDSTAFLSQLQGTHPEDSWNIRILMINDLGREYVSSDWNKQLIGDTLRRRFENGLPTIMVSGVPTQQWTEHYGDNVGSLLTEAFKKPCLL